jgi:hypothetical protein
VNTRGIFLRSEEDDGLDEKEYQAIIIFVSLPALRSGVYTGSLMRELDR